MRPAGPVPGTCDKSPPASLALLLTAGEARGLAPEAATGAGADTGGGVGSGCLGTGSGALTGSSSGSG